MSAPVDYRKGSLEGEGRAEGKVQMGKIIDVHMQQQAVTGEHGIITT